MRNKSKSRRNEMKYIGASLEKKNINNHNNNTSQKRRREKYNANRKLSK